MMNERDSRRRRRPRRPFVPPELVVYGDVTELTRAFGRGMRSDGLPGGGGKTG
jgi:hypothetical protein